MSRNFISTVAGRLQYCNCHDFIHLNVCSVLLVQSCSIDPRARRAAHSCYLRPLNSSNYAMKLAALVCLTRLPGQLPTVFEDRSYSNVVYNVQYPTLYHLSELSFSRKQPHSRFHQRQVAALLDMNLDFQIVRAPLRRLDLVDSKL